MGTLYSSPGPSLSRRDLLRSGGAGVVGASLAGCDLLSTDPSESDAPEDGDDKGKQAPMLADRVADGDLPDVEERLPENPMVIEPTQRVGRYGGRLRSAIRSGVSTNAQVLPLAAYDFLVRWTEEWTGAAGTEEVIPNVAESIEMSDDATVFTFQLRRGMKWSDGEPFTADDIVFAVDDVLRNEELFPVIPPIMSVDQEPGAIEKLDDYSFNLVFPAPRGLFLQQLATPDPVHLTVFPRHYLEQFHKDYNPDVDELVEEEGAADWVELFGMKSGPGNFFGENPDLPTLAAWQLTRSFAEGDSQVLLERNPYYWKVDPDGSQLPYIDEISFDLVNDLEVLLLKGSDGEIDVELGPDTRFTSLDNKPVLARGREEGDYQFVDLVDTRNNVMAIYLNLTAQDEVKRAIFQNKDFRIGLSYALDRQEMLDTAMQGQAEPYQVAPLPDSPFHDEEMATQYLEYDVDRANEHLDRAFPQTDDDGIRLGPDGNPIRFTIEYPAEFRPEWQPMVELVERYWRAVGVQVSGKNISRELHGTRAEANELEATVFQVDQGLSLFVRPDVYIATNQYQGQAWRDWYNSNGSEGEEPPSPTRRQMELFDQIKASPGAAEQTDLMKELIEIAKEEFYAIGTIRETQKYSIISNRMNNIPDNPIQGWDYPSPGPTRAEQYFIVDPE